MTDRTQARPTKPRNAIEQRSLLDAFLVRAAVCRWDYVLDVGPGGVMKLLTSDYIKNQAAPQPISDDWDERVGKMDRGVNDPISSALRRLIGGRRDDADAPTISIVLTSDIHPEPLEFCWGGSIARSKPAGLAVDAGLRRSTKPSVTGRWEWVLPSRSKVIDLAEDVHSNRIITSKEDHHLREINDTAGVATKFAYSRDGQCMPLYRRNSRNYPGPVSPQFRAQGVHATGVTPCLLDDFVEIREH